MIEEEMLQGIKVGWRVWFKGERIGYTVQARSPRYIICTKPFPLRKTVLYTIIDTVEKVRGRDNMVFGRGYETREQCERNLSDLECTDMEVSRRNRVPLFILKAQS